MRYWTTIILFCVACQSYRHHHNEEPTSNDTVPPFERVWTCLCLEELEGGWQNHPSDQGNIYNGKLYGTNIGITIHAIMEYNRRYGKDTLPPTAEYIKSLTIDEAKRIYHGIYWHSEWDTLYLPKACALFSLSIAMPAYYLIHRDRLLKMSADEIIDEFAMVWLPRLVIFRKGGMNRLREVRKRCRLCQV